ncbi:Long chronological lifespan protein 2 [Myotisia sp. PD_48]|nr:Long chronological lifespan protein 2 [Myotisia sp. PD_48]
MSPAFKSVLLGLLLFICTAHAQFQFFDNMFNGGQQEEAQQRNVPSDSAWYQRTYNGACALEKFVNSDVDFFPSAQCSRYLCPGTLACVHFPHHCPCQHPNVEEKYEFAEGHAICVSKGGFKAGEAARKIELARKGLL